MVFLLKKTMHVLTALLLTLAAVLTVLAPAALADGDSRVVIGANLSEEEIAAVYNMFGISRYSVPELTVTNSEERQYLAGKVDESMIGTNAISCVYVETLEPGSGLEIHCQNISWCTVAIYENALVTAGITDAKVIVAAPFSVSGTAALTGIYKAYESISGETLDTDAKVAAVDELLTTSELAEAIGSADATELVNELKAILDETALMTDEELREEILSIAEQIGVDLTEDQIQQLIALVRQLEQLDSAELLSRVQEVQGTVRQIGQAASNASGFFASITRFFDSIAAFFQRIFGGGN